MTLVQLQNTWEQKSVPKNQESCSLPLPFAIIYTLNLIYLFSHYFIETLRSKALTKEVSLAGCSNKQISTPNTKPLCFLGVPPFALCSKNPQKGLLFIQGFFKIRQKGVSFFLEWIMFVYFERESEYGFVSFFVFVVVCWWCSWWWWSMLRFFRHIWLMGRYFFKYSLDSLCGVLRNFLDHGSLCVLVEWFCMLKSQ